MLSHSPRPPATPRRFRFSSIAPLLGRALLTPFVLGTAGCQNDAPQESRLDEVAVVVRELGFDPRAGGPVLLLEEVEGSRQVAIWIGFAEARSIASSSGAPRPPPNSHDLTVHLLEVLHGVIERVIVHALRDGVYYAIIEVRTSEELLRIDARPSDAIAVGLRSGPRCSRGPSCWPADDVFAPRPEERSL